MFSSRCWPRSSCSVKGKLFDNKPCYRAGAQPVQQEPLLGATVGRGSLAYVRMAYIIASLCVLRPPPCLAATGCSRALHVTSRTMNLSIEKPIKGSWCDARKVMAPAHAQKA